MKRLTILALLVGSGLLTGCGDPNAEAPLGAHPADWYSLHRASTDLSSCRSCHGLELTGSGGAPSCFADRFDGRGCHPAGPGQAPHPLDGSYLSGTAHGPEAKLNLKSCQPCHSDHPAGGPGSNPRFNVGIDSAGGNGCESCHGTNYAHPPTWAGPANDVFHYLAGNVDESCALCHGAALDGVGGVGGSCLNCHAEVSLFALDCTACHGYPPDGVTAEPQVTALGGQSVAHRSVAAIAAHDGCAICHGVKSSGNANSGALIPSSNYRTFDATTGTPGDHWNGQINMNSGTEYNAASLGCDSAGCHANDAAHQLSDSALPVLLGNYGAGGAGAPHPLDGTFLVASAHGTTAKADLASCKSCHGEATSTNPRYTAGINAAGGSGCEGCHNDRTAHPSQGFFLAGTPRDNVAWYDGTWRHSSGAKATFATACGLCHPGLSGSGSIGPACTFCHVSNPVLNNSGCVSCHGARPDGATAPNRRGAHGRSDHRLSCVTCHTNAGPGSSDHFTRPAAPGQYARANLRNVSASGNMVITVGPNNVTCSGNCHGRESWY